IGISEVILLNIIQVTNIEQDSQKTFSCEEGSLYKDTLKAAESTARKLNISLPMPAISPQDVAVCSENPLDNLYISVDGAVSPCVYLYPPVPSPFTRIFCGNEDLTHHVSFGNIFTEPFDEIWAKKKYRDFRNAFASRQKRWTEAYDALLEMRLPKDSPVPDPPSPCRTCHKILGL
ncbi:MAG: SPASM domain-containing protein, partial [Candidatus Cloacimonadaceae bacterium]|nr:SPASM domain-containing protein [Candidatus Cloacimonadaceae bacterium]